MIMTPTSLLPRSAAPRPRRGLGLAPRRVQRREILQFAAECRLWVNIRPRRHVHDDDDGAQPLGLSVEIGTVPSISRAVHRRMAAVEG